MICHLTFDVPVTETGSDAALAAAPELSPVGGPGFGGRAPFPFLGHTMCRAGNGFLSLARHQTKE